MTILDQIISDKKKEVALKKELIPVSQLERSVLFDKDIISLKSSLLNSHNGIIAEHKRRSPSKAVINQNCSVEDVVKSYTKSGVAGISVLTDGKYFGGSLDDLSLARASTHLPILRKDFTVDEYQIIEAKAHGANAILIIAACLDFQQMRNFITLAKSIELEVLVEIHNKKELDKINGLEANIVGVNNRNLKTFDVSFETSVSLSKEFSKNQTIISESGIYKKDDVLILRSHGYKGFLIGENFMKSSNIEDACTSFVKSLS